MDFDYDKWVSKFPVFRDVLEEDAATYWEYAGNYFQNAGWQASLPNAQQLLFLLTCHLAWLWSPRDVNGNPSSGGPNPPPATVGRVSSGTQGSVSVQLEYDSNGSPSQAWYVQTPWGAAYWAATAQFRGSFYLPGLQRARRAAVPGLFPGRPLGGFFPFR